MRWGIALLVCLVCMPTAAFANSAVQTDNQYEDPKRDPTAKAKALRPDEDGRVPVEVRGAFGKGIRFRPADDAFSVHLRGRVQLQLQQTLDDDFENGRLVPLARRIRLVLGGHALNRAVTYYIQLGLGPRDLEADLRVPLRDAYVTWRVAPTIANLRLGQMKVPFDRQRVTSSSRLQLVDRSLLVSQLNLDRDVGVQVFSNDLFGLDKMLSYQLGIFGGEGRNRFNEDMGLLAMGRIQIATPGGFADFAEGDLERLDAPRFAIAAGAGFNHKSRRENSTTGAELPDERIDFLHATADALFKMKGLSLMVQFLLRRANARYAVEGRPLPADTGARSAWGWLGQAGYMVSDTVEVAARFSELRPFGSIRAPDFGRSAEAGAGVSWYAIGHNLKWQLDYFTLLSGNYDLSGHRARMQLQLFF